VSQRQPAGSPPNEAAAEQAPSEQAAMPSVTAALEAVLMVADAPVDELTLAQAVEHPPAPVRQALQALAARYREAGHGFELRDVAGGWRYYTRADCAGPVERFLQDAQQVRLTAAALETLAVVAYRQPVSRGRVSAVRGVNVDAVMRTLVTRGLVAESGADPSTGAVLYTTTSHFLERIGLSSLEELPDLAPYLPELDELREHLGAEDDAGERRPNADAAGDSVP